MVVVVIALLFQIAENSVRVFIGPIVQQHDIIAVEINRVLVSRLYDQGAIDTCLFLKAAVAVVPIRAVLPDREA
jgi:hypothetical protein